MPFPSLQSLLSSLSSLNCWRRKAQGVSGSLLWLSKGRDIYIYIFFFSQHHLRCGPLLTPGLSAVPLSLRSGAAGRHNAVACKDAAQRSHNQPAIPSAHRCLRRNTKNKKPDVWKERHACIHTLCTQKDICKKDVVTFGRVGEEIIGMMEIWAQAYVDTHLHTHTNLYLGTQERKTQKCWREEDQWGFVASWCERGELSRTEFHIGI